MCVGDVVAVGKAAFACEVLGPWRLGVAPSDVWRATDARCEDPGELEPVGVIDAVGGNHGPWRTIGDDDELAERVGGEVQPCYAERATRP